MPRYGHERVSNGNFDIAGVWTYGPAWTYDAVNKEADVDTPPGRGNLSQNIGVRLGVSYLTSFTIKNYNNGTNRIAIVLGGVAGTDRTANGTYTELITAGDTSVGMVELIPAGGTGASILSISNVSVRQVMKVAPLWPNEDWPDEEPADKGMPIYDKPIPPLEIIRVKHLGVIDVAKAIKQTNQRSK